MSGDAPVSLWQQTTLGSIAGPKRDLIFVNKGDTVASVLQLLKDKDIHSVPVFDGSSVIGIVTVLDILTFVSFHTFKEDATPDAIEAVKDLSTPIENLVGVFHEEDKKVWEYEEDFPVLKILEPFSKGVHRVVVRQANGDLRVLSQSDIIYFSARHLDTIADAKKTLQDLDLASRDYKLISISATDLALRGFRKMEIEGVAAVPVLDAEGKVVTTLSASDLKSLTFENITSVLLPTVEYLNKVNGSARKPVTVTAAATLGEVIIKVTENRVNRVWVVDDDNKPYASVSLSDIINRLQGIDEDLQSRALAVYGRQAMRQLFDTKVLISGLNGLGAEIAKNVILANVNSVTLHDTVNTTPADLNAHFYLSEEDIGNNRALSCLAKLRELNPSVKVNASSAELNNDLIAQHSIVVLIEVDNERAISLNEFARSKGIKFIKTDVNGLAGYLFNDFGPGFEVTDTNGEQPHIAVIAKIEENGRVQCVMDDRIEFEEGAFVYFSEVKGTTELNDGTPRKIKDVTAYSFVIEGGIEGYGEYISGGIVTEAKLPKVIEYKSLKESLADPGFLEDPDMSKFGRSNVLHSAFKALDRFKQQNGRLPAPASAEDADKLLALTQEVVNELPEDVRVGVEGHESAIKKFAHGSRAVLNAMASSFGGIVGQEVIKAATHKFTPFTPWLFFDSFESIGDSFHPAEEYEPQGSRYDANIQVFGKSFQEKLGKLRYFLVGSGALGCEFLKNFAMSGIGAGDGGSITVTDDDVIEKSNLSRQFLFRNWHIHKPKSACAAEAAKAMNPKLNVRALQERVSPLTEHIFNDEFWANIDGVCNALDNINARLYMDKRCIFYEKPLLESGTLGTKCHSQVVLPHKTQHYGAKPDPPEKEAPMCVLHNFPHNIQHCLTWGRSEFGGNFEVAPSEVRKYITEDNYVKSLLDAKIGENDIKEKLNVIKEFTKSISTSFKDCVEWARLKFEDYYTNKIKELIFNFPEDSVNKTGGLFWSPPKRFPKPLVFDPEDPTHLQFIISGANLRANIFNVEIPKTNRKPEYFKQLLNEIIVPEFVPSKKQIKVEESDKDELADLSVDQLQQTLPSKQDLSHLDIRPEDFEKDNDYNFHMDFIASASNLRARNYAIEEVDKLRAKLIAGRIIPAIATATALATGLITLELYKIVNDRDVAKDFLSVGDFRCAFVNLAIPQITITEPEAPEQVKDRVEISTPDPLNHPEYTEEEEILAYPPNHTIWDKIRVDIGRKGITVQEFINYVKEHHSLHTEMVSIPTAKGGGLLIYSRHVKSTHERLNSPLADLYASMTGENIAHKNFIVPECYFTNAEGTNVQTPAVVVTI